MQSSKIRRDKRTQSKKEKLSKLIKNDIDSDGGESEHELSHYLNDRVKLMKEVLKIIKPKKIRAMAPDCMQNLDSEEINSMLLDELLGISNKRLKYIFKGQTLNEESSSTDTEEEQPVDIISLDDISDDEFIIDLDSDTDSRKKHKRHKNKIKEEPKKKRIKREKSDKIKNSEEPQNQMSEQNLMSVLELLELQARARAIRSQLVLENTKKAEEAAKVSAEVESSDNEDAVIVESPDNVEIVIASSDSENEHVQNIQQNPIHQFRKATDDSPEKNSKETAGITQKYITGDESESSVITKITSIGKEVISMDSNIGELGDNSSFVVENAKEPDTISNEEPIIGVVHIPLPKDQNDHSAAISTEKIVRESREQQSLENTEKTKNSNLKCGTESESNANPIDCIGKSYEIGSKGSKSLNEMGSGESKSINDKNAKKAGEKSQKKMLKESDNSNSKSTSPSACSSVKNIPHFKRKENSQDIKDLIRNDDGRSKVQEDESSTESNTMKSSKADHEPKKDKSSRICRRKLSKLAKEKANNLESKQRPSVTSKPQEKHPVNDKGGKISLVKVPKKSNETNESDGIILNVDQSEMDCIHLD